MNTVSVHQKGGNAQLTSALLIYTQSGNQYSSDRVVNLVTEHEVSMVKGQPVIEEGKILSQKSMREMARSILKQKRSSLTLIPEHMLAQGENTYVWWMPAQKKKVFFRASNTVLENRCGVVEIPSCIFAIVDDNAYVLCFKGKERPNAQTELYFSPFFNVGNDHEICMGSTQKTRNGDVEAWTKAYFNSAFSHSNYWDSDAEILREGGREQLWRDLLDKKVDGFPFECLPPAKLTLEQFIVKISK